MGSARAGSNPVLSGFIGIRAFFVFIFIFILKYNTQVHPENLVPALRVHSTKTPEFKKYLYTAFLRLIY